MTQLLAFRVVHAGCWDSESNFRICARSSASSSVLSGSTVLMQTNLYLKHLGTCQALIHQLAFLTFLHHAITCWIVFSVSFFCIQIIEF